MAAPSICTFGFRVCKIQVGSTSDLLSLQISTGVLWQSKDIQLSRNTLYLLSPRHCFFIVVNIDLYVNRDNSLTN